MHREDRLCENPGAIKKQTNKPRNHEEKEAEQKWEEEKERQRGRPPRGEKSFRAVSEKEAGN